MINAKDTCIVGEKKDQESRSGNMSQEGRPLMVFIFNARVIADHVVDHEMRDARANLHITINFPIFKAPPLGPPPQRVRTRQLQSATYKHTSIHI